MSTWGDMARRAEGAVKKEDLNINKMLTMGIVHFVYKKKDVVRKGVTIREGDVREAWGTKKMEIVDRVPHGGDCPPKRVGYTTYFDVEKGDWRVFWEDSIMELEPKIYSYEEFRRATSKPTSDVVPED